MSKLRMVMQEEEAVWGVSEGEGGRTKVVRTC